MKIYCSEINLAKPNNIQIWVSKNSDYGIGISVIKDGEQIDAKLFDGDTEIQSSNSLDKYTVFNMKSANTTETKNLTVKASNQEIKLFVNTTDSDCAEVTPPMPEMPEPGLNEEGVKAVLSSGNVETINASMLNASGSITTPVIAAYQAVQTEQVDTYYLNVMNDVTIGNTIGASIVQAYDIGITNSLRFTDYETGEDIVLTVSDIKQLLQLINK